MEYGITVYNRSVYVPPPMTAPGILSPRSVATHPRLIYSRNVIPLYLL
jgi:hypothetical protein